MLCSSFFFCFLLFFCFRLESRHRQRTDTVKQPLLETWRDLRPCLLAAGSPPWVKHRGNLTISTQHMFFTLSLLYVFDVKYQSYKDQLSYMFLYTTYYEYKMYQII